MMRTRLGGSEDGLSGELEGKEVVLMAVWVEGYLLSIADSKHH